MQPGQRTVMIQRVGDDVVYDAAPDAAIVDAIAAAVIVTDLTGRIVRWNAQAEQLYGFPAEQMLGGNVVELFVHPEDRARAGEIMTQVMAGQSWTGDFSVRTADGSAKLVRITDSPVLVDGQAVAVVGTAFDVTQQRVEEAEAADRERRLELAMQAADLGTWRWDIPTSRTVWDARLEQIFGLSPGGFDGTFETYVSLLHEADRARVLATVQAAVESRSPYELRHRIVRPDGAVRWIECRAQVTVADDEVTGTVGCSWDVTDRVDVQQELAVSLGAAEQAGERLRVMQHITEALAAAMSLDEVVSVVRDHARNALGASSAGVVLPDQRRRALTFHAAYGDATRPNLTLGPVAADGPRLPMTHVASTGQPLYLRSPGQMLDMFPDLAPLLASSASRAVACVPIPLTSGALHGALVVNLDHEHDWAQQEQALLQAMARQCGVALERAALLQESRRVAEQLQAGLLPQAIPQVDGLELAAVYRPGGEAAEQLGGDWFDVLPLGDGRVVLIIGDVMGRGVDAAATMARMSTAIRAFAGIDPDPAVVLRHADAFVRREAPEGFVTVAYAVLDPAALTLTVASAGHLPLLVLRADGVASVELPGMPPLGLISEERDTRTVALRPGDALLLTTDGLIERPGVDVEDALLALGEEARRELRAGAAVTELVQDLVRNAPPGSRDDDMTLLVARVAGRRAT